MTFTCIYVYTFVYVYIDIYMCVYTLYVHLHVHIYIYTHVQGISTTLTPWYGDHTHQLKKVHPRLIFQKEQFMQQSQTAFLHVHYDFVRYVPNLIICVRAFATGGFHRHMKCHEVGWRKLCARRFSPLYQRPWGRVTQIVPVVTLIVIIMKPAVKIEDSHCSENTDQHPNDSRNVQIFIYICIHVFLYIYIYIY